MPDLDNYWTRLVSRGARRFDTAQDAPGAPTRRALLRGAALAGAGLATAGLTGCGRHSGPPAPSGASSQATGGTPQRGGTLSVVSTASPATLDPHATANNATTSALSYSLNRLVRFKTGPDPATAGNWEMENDLAQSVESPDAATWTVKIRPANFHNVAPVNGHAVESEDIKQTFTRAVTDTKNPSRGNLNMIDPAQIQTPDKQTVVFKLNYKLSMFPWTLASPFYSFILPREAASGAYDPGKQIIGSGPFIFDSYQPDVAFTYHRNPSYFEQGLPYLDNVRAAVITDASQLLAQFTTGHLDTYQPPVNNLDAAQKAVPNATLLTYFANSGGGYPTFFPFKDKTSPFQDIRMRQAVSMAIDRDTINKVTYNGTGKPAYVLPVGFGKWALQEGDLSPQTAPFYKYNPAQAKQLLSAAGHAGYQVKLGYTTNFAPFAQLPGIAQTINSMLNAVGFQSTLVGCDYTDCYIGGGRGARFGNRPGDEVYLGGFTTFSGPDEALYNYYDSHSSANSDGLQDPKLDALIDHARTVLGQDAQAQAYKDVQRYMADQVYAAWGMPQSPNHTMIQPRLQNYSVGLAGAEGVESYLQAWIKA